MEQIRDSNIPHFVLFPGLLPRYRPPSLHDDDSDGHVAASANSRVPHTQLVPMGLVCEMVLCVVFGSEVHRAVGCGDAMLSVLGDAGTLNLWEWG